MKIDRTESRLVGALVTMAVVALAAPVPPVWAQPKPPGLATEQNRETLLEQIASLNAQVERLQATVQKCQTVGCPPPAATTDSGTKMAEHGMGAPQGGGMQGGGMMPEHPMGTMGQGSPPMVPNPQASGMMGVPPPSGATPTAPPPANPPAAMDHM